MTDAQMKFLEERRRQQGKAAPAPAPATKPAAPETIQGEAAGKVTRAQDIWKFCEGSGALGTYTVWRHGGTGSVVELWHEGAGSFTFARAAGAQPKYCSSMGSMQDEAGLNAPSAVGTLEDGRGGAWRANGVDAGCWGYGEARGRRIVYLCTVQTREGPEAVELHLTREGFVFRAAEGFKCVLVRGGELLQINRSEVSNHIKAADADAKPEADKENSKRG